MEITRKISLQRKSVQLPFLLLLTLCFSILFQANYRIVDNFSFRESITLATLPTYYLTNVFIFKRHIFPPFIHQLPTYISIVINLRIRIVSRANRV